MKTWKFGIVGTGMIAAFHAKAIQSLKNAELCAVFHPAIEKATAFAGKHGGKGYADYTEMLQNSGIDIVTIATPSGLHHTHTIEAAKYKKHVLCEKPLEINLNRIDAMIQAHEENNTYLGGIFNYRYDAALRVIEEAVNAQRLGTISYAAVHVPWWRHNSYYHNSWKGTKQFDGGGALMNQSIHMIDILLHLMGEVQSLKSYTATIAHPQIEVEDTAVSILKFKNHALGFIYGTTASFPGQYRRLELTGTKGTIIMEEDCITLWHLEPELPQDKEIIAKYSKTTGGGGVSDPSAISYANHAKNIEAFIKAIENGQRFEIDGKEARKAVELILQIYEDAKK